MKARIKKKRYRKALEACVDKLDRYSKPERRKFINEVCAAWKAYMKARAWNIPKEG